MKKTKEKVTVVSVPSSSSRSWSESLREMLSLAGYLTMSQGDRVVSVPDTVAMPSSEGKDDIVEDGDVDKAAAMAMAFISEEEGEEGFLSVSDVVVRLEASCRLEDDAQVGVVVSAGEEKEQDYVLVAKD